MLLYLFFFGKQQMLGQLNATLEEENKALVEQVNKLVEQVTLDSNMAITFCTTLLQISQKILRTAVLTFPAIIVSLELRKLSAVRRRNPFSSKYVLNETKCAICSVIRPLNNCGQVLHPRALT